MNKLAFLTAALAPLSACTELGICPIEDDQCRANLPDNGRGAGGTNDPSVYADGPGSMPVAVGGTLRVAGNADTSVDLRDDASFEILDDEGSAITVRAFAAGETVATGTNARGIVTLPITAAPLAGFSLSTLGTHDLQQPGELAFLRDDPYATAVVWMSAADGRRLFDASLTVSIDGAPAAMWDWDRLTVSGVNAGPHVLRVETGAAAGYTASFSVVDRLDAIAHDEGPGAYPGAVGVQGTVCFHALAGDREVIAPGWQIHVEPEVPVIGVAPNCVGFVPVGGTYHVTATAGGLTDELDFEITP